MEYWKFSTGNKVKLLLYNFRHGQKILNVMTLLNGGTAPLSKINHFKTEIILNAYDNINMNNSKSLIIFEKVKTIIFLLKERKNTKAKFISKRT